MIDEKEVEERLANAGPDRVWDGKEGIGLDKAKRRGIKIKYCLLRDDGWTIGCAKEHRASAEELYKDSWLKIYFINDEGFPAIKLNYDEWLVLGGETGKK